MKYKHSKYVVNFSRVYLLIALICLYMGITGISFIPGPFPLVELNSQKSIQLEQVKTIYDKVIKQKPDNLFFAHFYRAARFLKDDYNDLLFYKVPVSDGDSFLSRIASFNQAVNSAYHMFKGSMIALLILSSGAVLLLLFLLVRPGYLASLLLGTFPGILIIVLKKRGLSFEPVTETYIAVFFVLGLVIYLFQLVFSFKYGKLTAQDTYVDLYELHIYRKTLFFFTFGMLATIFPILGDFNTSHSLAIWLFGAEVMGYIVFFMGILSLIVALIYFIAGIRAHKQITDEANERV